MSRAAKKNADGALPASASGIPKALIDVLVDVLGVDASEITSDSKLREDLGADELDLVEIQLALEELYGLVTTEDEWVDDDRIAMTVGDVVVELTKLGATS